MAFILDPRKVGLGKIHEQWPCTASFPCFEVPGSLQLAGPCYGRENPRRLRKVVVEAWDLVPASCQSVVRVEDPRDSPREISLGFMHSTAIMCVKHVE